MTATAARAERLAARRRSASTREGTSTRTLRAVIYCRASLDKTGDAESVSRQEDACRKLADLRGWTVVVDPIIDNSFSAWDEDKVRPGWDRVLGMVERGEVDVVIAWHIDRMTRSMTALERLINVAETTGVAIATATGDIDLSTDMGRMVARILAAVARAEVERKAARQWLANETRAIAGEPWRGGARVFGYERDGVTVVEHEAEAIRWAAQAALDGASMGDIVAEFTTKGLRSPSAQIAEGRIEAWSRNGVRRMLANPRYAAIRTYLGDEVAEGQWPAILTPETHRALVELFADPTRRNAGKRAVNNHAPENLCTGIARCQCGDTVRASAKGGRNRYVCRSNAGCILATRETMDAVVINEVLGLMTSPGFLASLVPNSDEDAAAAQRRVDLLRDRLDNVRAEHDAGLYDGKGAEYRERVADLATQIKEARAALDSLVDTGDFDCIRFDDAQAVVDSWSATTIAQKRAIVARLLDIEVRAAGKGRHGWQALNERHLIVKRRVAVAA